MRNKRWSLSVPLDAYTLAEHRGIAEEAEGLGYTDAWSFEVDGTDCFSPLAVVGMATHMRVGTAIANVFTRGPATLATCAAGLAEIAPERFCLGIGSGSQPIVEAWNGGTFRRPATRVREMVQFLRLALTGERVVFRGEELTVDGFRLSRPPLHPIPIYVAALRPGMLRVAGELADGVILNWLSASDVRQSIRVVREAALGTGRDAGDIEVTARVLVDLDPPGPASDMVVRRYVAAYLNVPVYKSFHEWLGRAELLMPMWSAWASGDRKGAVAAVPQEVVSDLILRGPVEEIRSNVQGYLDAGVETVFLSLSTAERDPARKRQILREAIQALAPRA